MTNPTHYYSIILCTRVFSAPTIIIPTMIRMIGRMNQKQKQHLMRDQMSQPPFPDELTLLDLSRSKYHSQCVRLIEFTILSGLLTGPDWPSFSPISTLIDKIWICDSLKTGSPIRIQLHHHYLFLRFHRWACSCVPSTSELPLHKREPSSSISVYTSQLGWNSSSSNILFLCS